MKGIVVRIILAIFVGTLIGYSIAIGPALYQQILDNRALLDAMATNPAYKVIEAIESHNPRVTVLTVTVVEERNNVAIWVLQDTVGLSEEEYPRYLVDTLANMWQALVDFYPRRANYIIVIGRVVQVSTVEGAKVQIRGISFFAMDSKTVQLFLDEPTEDSLDVLYAQGKLIFELFYRPVTLEDILPRESGYIPPWGSGVDCNTCP